MLYKLKIKADLKDKLNCAAILENITLAAFRETNSSSIQIFTCLFARVLRQIIGWRNRMA